MDPRTCILLINGCDCFGKSLIAIPFCKGPMSLETPMSRISMNPWLLHCTLWLKPCVTSFRSDGCRSFASSSHEYQSLISFPLEIFMSRTLRQDPSTGCKLLPLLSFQLRSFRGISHTLLVLSPSTTLQVLNPSSSAHFLQ